MVTMKRAQTTRVSKAAIATSRKYPERNVWNNVEAFKNSGIASTMLGVEKRLYINGHKIG